MRIIGIMSTKLSNTESKDESEGSKDGGTTISLPASASSSFFHLSI